MTKPVIPLPRQLSRRQLLKAGTGTAALLAAVKLNFPAGAFAQGSGPEVKGAKLGFIALTDAAPLFIAKEKGIFAKYGLPETEVLKQASWGTTRDNLVLGSEGNGIDGAHILTPMPYLISAGKVTQNNVPTPMYILARLNLNGQSISVGKEYAELKIGLDTAPFKAAIAHYDTFGRKLDALRTGVLNDGISAVAERTDIAKASLFEVVGSSERDGLTNFAERIGELGAAFNAVLAQAGQAPASPFQFDQFFLESLHDLGQRDWSDAT